LAQNIARAVRGGKSALLADAAKTISRNRRQAPAFAHGPHFCVGAHLARLETELAATAIIELPGLRLSGHAVPRGVVFRKPPQLYATWEVT
jgi:cytochrome P450